MLKSSKFVRRLPNAAHQKFSFCSVKQGWISSKFYTPIFLYESKLSSFSLLRVWLWTNFRTKNARVKCWWNWLQRDDSLSLWTKFNLIEKIITDGGIVSSLRRCSRQDMGNWKGKNNFEFVSRYIQSFNWFNYWF